LTESNKQATKLNLYTVLGTLLGIGFIPIMPGTFGTLAAVVAYLGLPIEWFNSLPGILYLIAGIIILYFLGVFITGKAEQKLGHDAGSIVLDEFVGYFICVLFLPHSILMAIYTFALFRVFDIAKPQPVKLLQKLKGGWGVMTDDVMAAVYTNLFMQIMIRIYPRFFNM
jgi:phosphatidylglycerophosphatase A